MSIHAIVLAAGQGTRMRSRLPKVLHELAGRPLLQHVLDGARDAGVDALHVVIGYGGTRVRDAIADERLQWVEQPEQLGTGHAVMQALPAVPDDATVLVLYGDVPLVRPATMRLLLAAATDGPALLSVFLSNPSGYGRILRAPDGGLLGIVEHKDATPEQLDIRETNSGLLACPAGILRSCLGRCSNDNAQGEYYLTDVIGLAVADGLPVSAVVASDSTEVTGINDRVQLAAMERAYQRRQAEDLMRAGVTVADPERIDVRGALSCGTDVFIDVNCVFEGRVRLAEGVRIGPNCLVRESDLGPNTVVEANSVLEQAVIGSGVQVGPFARLRPGTDLADNSKVGNFVEIKKARLGEGSKANHLSYIGDASVGAGVNIGAGTITCNYDGVNKHQTVIEDGAFIGSDTQLIAPVTVGRGAVIGAGTTVTRDVSPDSLATSRARQSEVAGWRSRRRG
ncbi:bifunctional UDP-N-acetylglucosamine diphosphorylase/glucosamine-1-phosphate N-acetyltransferase GlmU [Methylonatrum kenyense]|uniref:bifunctional UDP-N-acetylglucosamine diphosphorylase/glucosamine-1-phosphate N-acetyltransferase GlmU n=1 Tax=Methylonatrum kenyense TaxID=455253 RepID=UPI0020BF41D6|nr:bifunctional UDP-N-acetylglucosamine diphosphorylase/glucosamine-1-phosphate N-acetyltransferase GlmU [Methylonatrum kenyense]MCK8515239.1 bifunctional UDP-N-acetylglucosamine diphosphorylase/glucosamine-1-phosphate N-acetyltransferase GlmU [Methylonatrum kenyense]